ncbi:hypothetical protein SARC_17420, partial [Sphaeroforma arctica JP610]
MATTQAEHGKDAALEERDSLSQSVATAEVRVSALEVDLEESKAAVARAEDARDSTIAERDDATHSLKASEECVNALEAMNDSSKVHTVMFVGICD